MKTKIVQWSIRYLYSLKDQILEQPKYQRKEVWKDKKKKLLIDSLIREIDIPKIYLRSIDTGIYKYEVADGQQRISAIYKFLEDVFPLSSDTFNGLDLSKIDGITVGGKKYTELNRKLRNRFDKTKITIAIISKVSNSDIRTLFGRLQMGDPLVPAEIRNAIISNLGSEIDNIALNHNFFDKCRISSERYKHQDYLTHIFALIHYKNKESLKAPLFLKLYFDLAKEVPRKYISDCTKILEWMIVIDRNSQRRIVNKWSFVDFFWFLYLNKSQIKNIDLVGIAQEYDEFERKRLENNQLPDKLVVAKRPTNMERNLYKYIVSFNTDGKSPHNISRRADVFSKLFSKYLTLK